MDVVSRRIGLTAWGRLYGFDKATTARRHHAGWLPPALPLERLPNGRCHGVVPPAQEGRGVVYERVASVDRKADPGQPVGRVAAWATQQGCRPDEEVKAIGSGPDGHRRRWRRVAEHTAGTIVVEHRARVTRFGFEYLEAAWAGRDARIPVMAENEPGDNPARDATEVPTALCARLYWRRSARRRAERALATAQAG